MTTDFRALCAELIASWDADGCDWKPQHQARWEATVNRARAALAEPECREPASVTGQPSDEELADTYWKAWHEYHDRTNSVLHSVGLRAVLARWGHQPAPPADGEVAELVSAVHAAYAAYGWVEEKQFIRFFDEVSRLASVIEEGCDCSVDGPINWQDEIELMCQRLKPVPVSERPWEREGWCDVEGRFWAEHISRSGVASWRCAAASDLGGWAVRCLPAHALPLPEVGED